MRWFPGVRPSHEIYLELSRDSLFPDALVLHLGAGYDSHNIVSKIGETRRLISVDIDWKKLLNNKNLFRIVGDGSALLFKGMTFDFIMSENVLEHLIEPRTVFNECYRCLKVRGGEFFDT